MTGDFASVDGKPRNGGAAVDADSGEVDPDWAPKLGIVTDAIAATPQHVVVATGAHVDAYDLSTGAQDPGFRLSAPPGGEDNGVRRLVVSGDRLYVGGRFTEVNGVPRRSLVRVDARTGQLDRGWRPPPLETYKCRTCGGPVDDLAVTPSTVYAVGDFYRAGRARTRGGLAAFRTAGSGPVVGSFRAQRPGRTFDGIPGGTYGTAALVGSRLFTGGDFGGEPLHGFATLDARTGAVVPSWHPARHPELVKLVAPSGPNAFVAGDKLAP
jgi:hypothetical protein